MQHAQHFQEDEDEEGEGEGEGEVEEGAGSGGEQQPRGGEASSAVQRKRAEQEEGRGLPQQAHGGYRLESGVWSVGARMD